MSGTLEIIGFEPRGTYSFGDLEPGAAAARQFTLSNAGKEDLVLGNLSVTGAGFALLDGDNPSGTTLGAFGSTTATVTALVTEGDAEGRLIVPSDDEASPYLLNLAAAVARGRLREMRPARIARLSR